MSHYDVLGVERTADRAALRQAYLRLARAHHPDRQGGDPARMQAINRAWNTLSDPDRRAHYDRTLALDGTAVGEPSATSSRPAPGARPGYEPDPRYDPSDDIGADEELRRDLADDRPLGPDIVLPRWLRMIPITTFAAAFPVFIVSVVVASEPGLAFAFMLVILSGVFFLAAPFMALLASRRNGYRDVDD